MTKRVAILMGSDSDWEAVKPAAAQLKAWDIPFEVRVLSAHRTPAEAAAFAAGAEQAASAYSSPPPVWRRIWRRHRRQHHAAGDRHPHQGRARPAGWTRCWPPCRCRRASPWPPWR